MSRLFVISGPSGCGKSTLCNMLETEDKNVKFSVSATTRAARVNEVNGVDYFFLTSEDFDKRLKAGEFYEHAEHFGNKYGTLKAYVDTLTSYGYDVLLDIDVVGAKQVKAKNSEAVLIFIMPPSIEELQRRLIARNTESPQQLEERLDKAITEIRQSDIYEHIIINDDLSSAYRQFKAVVESYR